MTLEAFSKACQLFSTEEVEKVRLLAFYHHKTAGMNEFGMSDILGWFAALNLAKPNESRLRRRLAASRAFVRGGDPGVWKLHALALSELQAEYPGIGTLSEDVISDDTLLPRSLYEGTRGFIESLARQINASFEYNIFDGCAVLMRRLLEVLLILSYEHLGIETEIQDAAGNYLPLERVVANASTNKQLRLSRNSKTTVDLFRTLGNFAAHKIYFTCRRTDIKGVAAEYRALIEELLYKAGIRA